MRRMRRCFLSQAIASDEYAMKENPKYINKVVAPTLEPVKSIGGFRTMPDYSFDTMPDDYAVLVLIGGFGWSTPVAERVVPIVKKSCGKREGCRRNMQCSFVYGKARFPQCGETYRQWA